LRCELCVRVVVEWHGVQQCDQRSAPVVQEVILAGIRKDLEDEAVIA
jgi:hypothetical protein